MSFYLTMARAAATHPLCLAIASELCSAPWPPPPRRWPPLSRPLTLPWLFLTSSPRSRSGNDERDVALYSLGVRACNADAEDEKELQLVYSRDGASSIKVLPTFVSSFIFKSGSGLCSDVPGLNYDPKLLLHGQHYIEIYRPIPSRANVTNKIKVAGLHDRGKAAVLELEILTCLEGSDDVLCMNRSTIYLRGAGGFSDSSTFSYATYAANEVSNVTFPDSTPSAVYEDRTPSMAHSFGSGVTVWLIRLFGSLAFRSYFCSCCRLLSPNTARPVYARVRRSSCHEVVLQHGSSGRKTHLLQVYPGETLVTEMWLQEQSRRVYYRTKVKERGRAVLSGYVSVSLRHITSSL